MLRKLWNLVGRSQHAPHTQHLQRSHHFVMLKDQTTPKINFCIIFPLPNDAEDYWHLKIERILFVENACYGKLQFAFFCFFD